MILHRTRHGDDLCLGDRGIRTPLYGVCSWVGVGTGAPKFAFKLSHWPQVEDVELTTWGVVGYKFGGPFALLGATIAAAVFLGRSAGILPGLASGTLVLATGIGATIYARRRWGDGPSFAGLY